MRIRILAGAALAVAMLGVPAAQAASPAYTTANVNFRTGPDTEFPSVGVIPEGDDIYVEGCLRDESWCDVRWDGDRGWVYSEYIAFDYRGDTVLLPDVGVSVFGIPIVVVRRRPLLGPLLRGSPLVQEPRPVVQVQVASASRLARTAQGQAHARLVASGI